MARALSPGEVVSVWVTVAAGAPPPQGTLDGKELSFFPLSETRFVGLAGFDLDDEAGVRREFVVDYRDRYGVDRRWRKTIVLEAKKFPVNELDVDAAYVDLSVRDAARAEDEAKLLGDIYSRHTRKSCIDGNFALPVKTAITARFGSRRVFNGVPKAPHAGIDLRARTGDPVYSPACGEVVLTGELFYTGKTVVIDHGFGLYSIFGHLSRVGVAMGQTVSKRTMLGRAGATGRATGPHVHWSVKYQQARVDPESLLAIDLGMGSQDNGYSGR